LGSGSVSRHGRSKNARKWVPAVIDHLRGVSIGTRDSDPAVVRFFTRRNLAQAMGIACGLGCGLASWPGFDVLLHVSVVLTFFDCVATRDQAPLADAREHDDPDRSGILSVIGGYRLPHIFVGNRFEASGAGPGAGPGRIRRGRQYALMGASGWCAHRVGVPTSSIGLPGCDLLA